MKATWRKLQSMAKALRTTGRVGPAPGLSLKPGARLVREWRGTRTNCTGYETREPKCEAGSLACFWQKPAHCKNIACIHATATNY